MSWLKRLLGVPPSWAPLVSTIARSVCYAGTSVVRGVVEHYGPNHRAPSDDFVLDMLAYWHVLLSTHFMNLGYTADPARLASLHGYEPTMLRRSPKARYIPRSELRYLFRSLCSEVISIRVEESDREWPFGTPSELTWPSGMEMPRKLEWPREDYMPNLSVYYGGLIEEYLKFDGYDVKADSFSEASAYEAGQHIGDLVRSGIEGDEVVVESYNALARILVALFAPRVQDRKTTCDSMNTNGRQCQLAAGWGTDHLGVGRCKYHEGERILFKFNEADISAVACVLVVEGIRLGSKVAQILDDEDGAVTLDCFANTIQEHGGLSCYLDHVYAQR